MDVLITGVAGFIGSKVAKRFIAEGYKVYGIDDLSSGNINNIPKEINFIKADLIDPLSLSKIPSTCEIIIHLAGQSSGEISFHNPIEDLKKNTITTLNLINFGIKNKVKKILYASSMSVYGDFNCSNAGVKEEDEFSPKSCYGIGKLSSEKYLKIYQNQLPFVALRMFNVYGPGQDMNNMRQGMVSIFLSQAIKDKKIVIKGSLRRFRDFIYIDDVVECWYKVSLNENILNQAINIGTGKKTTVNDLVKKIQSITKVDEISILEGTPCDQLGIYSDITKLNQIVNVKPKVDLIEGLKYFYNWAKNN